MIIYVGLGLIGGAIYVLAPPRTDNKPDAIRQIILGAIAGFVAYLLMMSADPSHINDYTTYLDVIAVGYIAQDFLRQLFGGGNSDGGGNIP